MSTAKRLPPELAAKVMSLLREVDGEYEIVDMPALVDLILEHGQEYPSLRDLIQVNDDALLAHYRETGAVPPGIKIVETSTQEGSNVTELKVSHGPRSPHD
ncbi:MAG: hypothetical protein GC151_18675 [Betaproteobacteria bacterium]|nr:hypothetical protein [Betaproteobacteria bacterium]